MEKYIPYKTDSYKQYKAHSDLTGNLGFIAYTTELIKERRPKNRIEIIIDTSDEKQALRQIKNFKDTMLDSNTHFIVIFINKSKQLNNEKSISTKR